MSRDTGTKNTDYEETRADLLRRLRVHLLNAASTKPSFRELARQAGVSVPTLRHYFENRNVLIACVLEDLRAEGQVHLSNARRSIPGLEKSMSQAANSILAGVRYGQMDRVHALGLTEGLGNSELGPGYLKSILEPSLQAIECRLEEHIKRGEMEPVSVRHAAIVFAAPLILAALHQFELGGECVRPLNLAEFARTHVKAFTRGLMNSGHTSNNK